MFSDHPNQQCYITSRLISWKCNDIKRHSYLPYLNLYADHRRQLALMRKTSSYPATVSNAIHKITFKIMHKQEGIVRVSTLLSIIGKEGVKACHLHLDQRRRPKQHRVSFTEARSVLCTQNESDPWETKNLVKTLLITFMSWERSPEILHTIPSLLMKYFVTTSCWACTTIVYARDGYIQTINPLTSCRPNQVFDTAGERHDWRRLIGLGTTEIWLNWICSTRKKPQTANKKTNYKGMRELWNVPLTRLSCVWENMFHMWKNESFCAQMPSFFMRKEKRSLNYSWNRRPRARLVLHQLNCGAQSPAANGRHWTVSVCT